MTRKSITIAVAVLVAAGAMLAGGLAYAQRGPEGRHGFGGPGFGRGFEGRGPLADLNLSTEQREQVRAIFERHKEEFKSAGEKMEAARSAQRAAVDAVPFDESEIRSRTTEVANAEAEMAILRARVNGEVFQVLTPDQQTQLKERQAEWQKKMNDRREGRRRGGPPRPPAL